MPEVATRRSPLIWMAALLFPLALLIYANVLHAPFVWDDNNLVRDNLYLRSAGDLPKLLTENIGAGSGMHTLSYRPFQMLSYAADYAIWGLNPFGYHLTNLLLHFVAAFLVCLLVYKLYQDVLVAALTSLFFVVHPIHTEAVSYISGRADVLSAVFLLTAFILALENKSALFFLLSAAAAIFSREGGIFLPLFLVALCFAVKIPVKKNWLWASGVVVLFFLVMRIGALKDFGLIWPEQSGVLERLPGFFAAFARYVKLLIVPIGLHMEYGDTLFSWSDKTVWMGLGLFVGMLALIYFLRQKRDPFYLGVMWFMAGILPVSSIFKLNAYMAEHWMYWPSIGFFICLASGLAAALRQKELREKAGALVLVLLLSWSFLTVRQNRVWADPVRFYEHTLQFSPQSLGATINLGLVLQEKGDHGKALAHFEKAAQIAPQHYFPYFSLGNEYFYLGKFDRAIECYKKSLNLNPQFTAAQDNLVLAQNQLSHE